MYSYQLVLEERIPSLVKEKRLAGRCTVFNTPQGIVELCNRNFFLSCMAEEYVYLICADTKCHISGVFELSHGSADSSVLKPREVFIRALLAGAVNIILVHNHPSGDPTPSRDDFQITGRIRESGKMIGVELIDHIIIGDSEYYSFRENGKV